MKMPPIHRAVLPGRGFTLIEVMIAVTIFFMAMFSILGVLSAGVHAASMLRNSGPTPSMIAGYYYVTNAIQEGYDSGDFGDIATYEGYQWRSFAQEVATNDLYQLDLVVVDPNGIQSPVLSVLIYKPGSKKK
jgi:hypothetical protein